MHIRELLWNSVVQLAGNFYAGIYELTNVPFHNYPLLFHQRISEREHLSSIASMVPAEMVSWLLLSFWSVTIYPMDGDNVAVDTAAARTVAAALCLMLKGVIGRTVARAMGYGSTFLALA